MQVFEVIKLAAIRIPVEGGVPRRQVARVVGVQPGIKRLRVNRVLTVGNDMWLGDDSRTVKHLRCIVSIACFVERFRMRIEASGFRDRLRCELWSERD